MMAVTTANAKIASEAYVNQQDDEIWASIGEVPEDIDNVNTVVDYIDYKAGAAAGEVSLSSLSVTATAAELNVLDGSSATTADLNKLHDVTATAAELNQLDNVTLGAAAAKGVVTDVANNTSSTDLPTTAAVVTYVGSQAAASNFVHDGEISSSETAKAPSEKAVYDALALKQNAATAVTHTASTAAGSATNPVYISDTGVATAITSYPATSVTEDTTHRFVTDAEKSTWNGKQNAIGTTTGSDGTYVLTADIDDGTVTYKWELIQRADDENQPDAPGA